MKILKLFLLSFALWLVFGIVQAEETTQAAQAVALDENVTAGDLDVAEPNLTTNSPFYFFKNWGREIQSAFTFDSVEKAELRQKFANEKLIELKKVAENNENTEEINKATENYQKEVEKMEKAAERIKEKAQENDKVGRFLDKFIQQQALHQRVLQKLANQVPEQAFEKISEARERHIEKFGEVMNRLENKQNIQERLENNLEKVKGSEFKDFRSLEILKDLEEKAPEEAREAVKNARANTLIKLKEKIEEIPAEKLEQFKAYIEEISGEKERQMEILDNLKEELKEKPLIQQSIKDSTEKILRDIRQACAQVVTYCLNPDTGKCTQYSDACSAPKICRFCDGAEKLQEKTEEETQTREGVETKNLFQKNIIEPIKDLAPLQQLKKQLEAER